MGKRERRALPCAINAHIGGAVLLPGPHFCVGRGCRAQPSCYKVRGFCCPAPLGPLESLLLPGGPDRVLAL